MSDLREELRGFFERYADAFNRLDAEGIAAFFHRPCLMVNSDYVAVLPDGQAILANMQGLTAHHREQRAGRASISAFRVTELGAKLALVAVGWQVGDVDDAPLWDFENTYELVRHDGDWKILTSTTHG